MCPPCSSIPGVFTLRRIGKLVALAASEDPPAIDHRNTLTAPTGRAEEPGPFTAHVAGCCRQIDGIAFVLPFIAAASVPIGHDHAPQLCPDVDRSDDLAIPRPLPTEGASWRKEAATFPAPHINRPIALCRVLGPVMPSPPASTSAHDPSQIFPKSFGKMPDAFTEAISAPLRAFRRCLSPSTHIWLP